MNYQDALTLVKALETAKPLATQLRGYISTPFRANRNSNGVTIVSNGLTATYTPDTVTVKGTDYIKNEDNGVGLYPAGTRRIRLVSPFKEYFAIEQNSQKQYYLIPKEGLILSTQNNKLTPLNAIQDYQINIDRRKAKKAREDSGIADYIRSIWNVIPEPDPSVRHSPQSSMPNHTDLTKDWYEWVTQQKNGQLTWHGSRRDQKSLDWTCDQVDKSIVDLHMCYTAVPVSPNQMSHNLHSGKLPDLMKRGFFNEAKTK